MRTLSATTHIALGQTFLMTTLLLAAVILGLVPDHLSARREGRAALAEAIAVNGSALVTRGNIRASRPLWSPIVKRNTDILSAAVRRAGGRALVTIGDHDRHWDDAASDHSTDSQMTGADLVGGPEMGPGGAALHAALGTGMAGDRPERADQADRIPRAARLRRLLPLPAQDAAASGSFPGRSPSRPLGAGHPGRGPDGHRPEAADRPGEPGVCRHRRPHAGRADGPLRVGPRLGESRRHALLEGGVPVDESARGRQPAEKRHDPSARQRIGAAHLHRQLLTRTRKRWKIRGRAGQPGRRHPIGGEPGRAAQRPRRKRRPPTRPRANSWPT